MLQIKKVNKRQKCEQLPLYFCMNKKKIDNLSLKNTALDIQVNDKFILFFGFLQFFRFPTKVEARLKIYQKKN